MSDKRGNRDEFPAPVKRVLEQQAASRCCNPGCGQPTRAQSWDGTKSINIGTAAHIHAAAEGGARFDPSMTPEERKAADNGIWMCRNCGTLVDTDEGGFPADLLRAWKRDALESRRGDVVAPARRMHALLPTTTGEAVDQADVRRFAELIEELPTDSATMVWLRDWDGGSSYLRARLDPLERFRERWTTPERAFNTPRVQASLVTLTKAMELFLKHVYIDTFVMDGNSDFSCVPSEWHHKNKDKWDTAVGAINTHADATVAAHAELIRVAKEGLGT